MLCRGEVQPPVAVCIQRDHSHQAHGAIVEVAGIDLGEYP